MKNRIRILAVMTMILGSAAAAVAQQAKTAAGDAAIVKTMDDAMNPGEGQKRLESMVGRFDVRIFTWVDPSKPPFESRAVAITSWVLGSRYIQTMLSGFVMGEPFNGIGYAGFDNVGKKYQACYMDVGGTAMEWFTGTMAPDGKSAVLTATIYDAITLKPTKAEMRLSIAANGDHITELWQVDSSGKWVKVVELQYRRQQS